MVGFQLDDEPNLYMGNGCLTKHLFKKNWLFGVPGVYFVQAVQIFTRARSQPSCLSEKLEIFQS